MNIMKTIDSKGGITNNDQVNLEAVRNYEKQMSKFHEELKLKDSTIADLNSTIKLLQTKITIQESSIVEDTILNFTFEILPLDTELKDTDQHREDNKNKLKQPNEIKKENIIKFKKKF